MQLRNIIRKALTKTVTIQSDADGKKVRKKASRVQIPPSEKLVYGVYFAIAALFCLTILQAVHMVVLRTFSSEIFASITLVIGTILGVFFGAKT